MSTPNLAIIHIAAAQNQKEVTANGAFDNLDLALTNKIVENIPDTHFLLPLTDALQNMVFVFQGNLTTSRGVTLPSNKKLYIVSNQTSGSPLSSLTFGTASSPTGRTVTIPPSGASEYTILYCDGVNVDVVAGGGSSGGASIFSIGVFNPGTGSNAQILLYLKMDRPCIFQANAPNSLATAKTSATSPTVFLLKKNGVTFATVTFGAGSTTGTWAQAGDAIFSTGDTLEIDGPATADATLANFGLTLQGDRY